MFDTLEKTESFAKFIDSVFESQKTPFQMDYLFGSSSDDYYQKDNEEYARIFINKIPDEQDRDYRLTYIPSENPSLDLDRKIAIISYTTREATPLELEEKYERQWQVVRAERNRLLQESDVESLIYLPDYWSSKSDDYKSAWLSYRQELRDITESATSPFEIDWPVKPIVT